MFFLDFLHLKRLKNNLQSANTSITNFINDHPYAFTTLVCLSLFAVAKAHEIAELEEGEETDLTCYNWLNMASSRCFQRYSDLTWRCLNDAAKFYGLSPEQMLGCRNMAAQNQGYSEITDYDMINQCFTREGDFRLLRDDDDRYWDKSLDNKFTSY